MEKVTLQTSPSAILVIKPLRNGKWHHNDILYCKVSVLVYVVPFSVSCFISSVVKEGVILSTFVKSLIQKENYECNFRSYQVVLLGLSYIFSKNFISLCCCANLSWLTFCSPQDNLSVSFVR